MYYTHGNIHQLHGCAFHDRIVDVLVEKGMAFEGQMSLVPVCAHLFVHYSGYERG